MAVYGVNESQRKAARVAGFAYLLTMATVVFANLGIQDRLIVRGNAAETARNIIAHERLFRVAIACELIYCAGLIVLTTALYMILKTVDQSLALIGAFWRLVYALTWLLMTMHLFDAQRLASGGDSLQVFEAERLRALAMSYLGARFWEYYAGLLFYGLASAVCSYLWLMSNYIPRALAAFGAISSVWCAACTFTFVILPNFDKVVNLWWFDSPMGIFEIATGFLAFVQGIKDICDR